MKRYRLDPSKPRELTKEEARRLKATRIDYSDIPPLGDEFFSEAADASDMKLADDFMKQRRAVLRKLAKH